MTKLNIEKLEEQLYLEIEEEGLPYLLSDPLEIYKDLMNSKLDPYTGRLALATMLAETPQKALQSSTDLTAFIINECAMNQDIAEKFAEMYLSLLNPKQVKIWKKRENNGFDQICKKDHWLMHITLSAVWQTDQGHVDCSYDADIDVKVEDHVLLQDQISILLNAHPFISSTDLQEYLQSVLEEEANRDFDEFCNADDYYEPCTEDYSENLEYDIVIPFCKEYGLELLEVDGYGCSDAYVPDTVFWKRYGI